jgi:hypothetical protein
MRSGKKILNLSLLTACLVFVNCMVSIKSIKDPNFHANVSKVFIYLHGAQDAEKFFNGVGENLSKELQTCHVTSEIHLAGSLSLTSKSEIKDQIKSFNPDLIMQVIQTEYSTYNGAKSGAKIEIALFTQDSDKPVWKGALNSSTSGWGGMGIPSQIASKIVSQLVEDGILKRSQQESSAQNNP